MLIESSDFTIDAYGDMKTLGGDFQVSPADSTHLTDMLLSAPGDWKHDILLGAGIIRRLKSAQDAATLSRLQQDIRLQLDYDDWEILQLKVNTLNDITLNAQRKS